MQRRLLFYNRRVSLHSILNEKGNHSRSLSRQAWIMYANFAPKCSKILQIVFDHRFKRVYPSKQKSEKNLNTDTPLPYLCRRYTVETKFKEEVPIGVNHESENIARITQ